MDEIPQHGRGLAEIVALKAFAITLLGCALFSFAVLIGVLL